MSLFQANRCKTKTITTRSIAFSRALVSLLVFTWSSYWLLGFFSFPLIGCWDYFGFGLTTLFRRAIYGRRCEVKLAFYIVGNVRNVVTVMFCSGMFHPIYYYIYRLELAEERALNLTGQKTANECMEILKVQPKYLSIISNSN